MMVLWLEAVVVQNLSSLNKIVNPKSVWCYSSQSFFHSLPVSMQLEQGVKFKQDMKVFPIPLS